MSTASKKILISVSAVLLTVACVIGGLFVSGNLDSLVKAIGGESEETSETTEPETLSELKKGERPATLRGTRLYSKTDLKDKSTSEKLIDGIVSTGFNCILFVPDAAADSFAPAQMSVPSDELKYAVSYARSKGLYTVAAVNAVSSDSTQNEEVIEQFVTKVSFDALILDGLYSSLSTDKPFMPDSLKSFIDDSSSAGELIIKCPFEAISTDDDNSIFKSLSSIIERGNCATLFVEPMNETTGDKFSKGVADWKKYADASSAGLVVSQSASLIADKSGWERIEDVLSQISAVYKADDSKSISTVTCAYSSFCDDKECRSIIKGCAAENVLPENYLKSFKISNYSRTEITTDESRISFTGECNPLYPLTCNSEKVEVTEDGDFSIEYDLSVGKNKFVFATRGKTYTYTVNYSIDIIKNISPSGKLNTPGGSALEIRVTAHRDASVYATVNGKTVTMVNSGVLISGSEDVSMDTSSDYVTFTGSYNLPAGTAKNVSLGSIKAYASYKGISDSITGAAVTVTADQTIANLPVITYTPPSTVATTTTTTTTTASASTEPQTDEFGSEISVTDDEKSETHTTQSSTTTDEQTTTTQKLNLPALYTPYKYNGIDGTYRMCVVNTEYTETMPLSPLNDLSVPLTTPLLTGTFDFITGESSFDTYTYYNLASGRRVYRKDVTVIEKAYAMPANSMTVVSSGTASAQTYMNLHVTWKIPFNAVLNGQRYVTDSKNKREYAVTSLSATSLDITFYYTVSLNGKIDVSSSNVIKSYEWLSDTSKQTCTLRLNLKNSARFYGYSVKYNSDDTLHIAIKENKGSSVSGHVIMLDPGHGGSDAGAPCAANSGSYNEAKVCLQIAEKVKEKLQAMGATVLMTRTSNSDVTLVQRKLMARKNNPDLFLSIHCDAAYSSSAYGTTAYYYRPYSFALSKSIHSNLVSSYAGIYGKTMSTTDRGNVFFPYSVTRIEECPSILVEYGYISNISECKILQNSSNQDKLAAATAQGISNYFANN